MMDDTLDEILHNTVDILPDIAKCLPEQSKTITKFVGNLQKKKPEIAIGLLVASKICK